MFSSSLKNVTQSESQEERESKILLEAEKVHTLNVMMTQGVAGIKVGTATVINVQHLEGILNADISEDAKRKAINKQLQLWVESCPGASESNLFTLMNSIQGLSSKDSVEAIKSVLNLSAVSVPSTQEKVPQVPRSQDLEPENLAAEKKVHITQTQHTSGGFNIQIGEARDVTFFQPAPGGNFPQFLHLLQAGDIPTLKQVLRVFYQNHGQIEPPFQEQGNQALPLSSEFVRLTLIKEQAKYKQDLEGTKKAAKKTWQETRLSSFEDLHNAETRENIELGHLFQACEQASSSNASSCKRVLVYGRAGIGKTTLLRYLAYLSSLPNAEPEEGNAEQSSSQQQKPAWLADFDIVLYLPLRRLSTFILNKDEKSSQATAIFIRRCLAAEEPTAFAAIEKHLSVEVIEQLLAGNVPISDQETPPSFCLLLDGLDEARAWLKPADDEKENTRHLVLQSLLSLSGKPHIYSILSTRPMPVEIYDKKNQCQVVETMGFDDEAIRSYIHLNFNEDEQGTELEALLTRQPMAWGVAHVPVVLALICYIWAKQPKAEQEQWYGHFSQGQTTLTLTDIYANLLVQLQNRMQEKYQTGALRYAQSFINEGECLADDNPAMLFLEHLALAGMKTGSIFFEGAALHEAFTKTKIPLASREDFLSLLHETGLLCFEKITLQDRQKLPEDAHFFHLSIQEFLAACALRRLMNDTSETGEAAQCIAKYKHEPSFEIVWPFVAGLLLRNNVGRCGPDLGAAQQEMLSFFWHRLYASPSNIFSEEDCRLWARCLNEGLHECIPYQDLLVKRLKNRLWVAASLGLSEEYRRIRRVFSYTPQLTFILLRRLWSGLESKDDLTKHRDFFQRIKRIIDGNDDWVDFFMEESKKLRMEVQAIAFQLITCYTKDKKIAEWGNLLLCALKSQQDDSTRKELVQALPRTLSQIHSKAAAAWARLLLEALGKPENQDLRKELAGALEKVYFNLPEAAAAEWVERLLTTLQQPENKDIRKYLAYALQYACERLPEATAEKWVERLFMALQKPENKDIRFNLVDALQFACERLPEAAAEKWVERLLTTLQKPENTDIRFNLVLPLQSACERLPEATAEKWVERLLTALQQPKNKGIRWDLAYALQSACERLPEATAEKWVERLLTTLQQSKYQYTRAGLGLALQSACKRLPEATAEKWVERLLTTLQQSKNQYTRGGVVRALESACKRLPEATAAEWIQRLSMASNQPGNADIQDDLARALESVCGRLPKAAESIQPLLDALMKTDDSANRKALLKARDNCLLIDLDANQQALLCPSCMNIG